MQPPCTADTRFIFDPLLLTIRKTNMMESQTRRTTAWDNILHLNLGSVSSSSPPPAAANVGMGSRPGGGLTSARVS